MNVTDWRGNTYTLGDTILYPRMSGRSVEMQEAVVVDLYHVHYSRETWDWARLPEGEAVTAETPLRVRVRPTGRGSRKFYAVGKDVTILITDNITKVEARS